MAGYFWSSNQSIEQDRFRPPFRRFGMLSIQLRNDFGFLQPDSLRDQRITKLLKEAGHGT
jgi:hypothetical protein